MKHHCTSIIFSSNYSEIVELTLNVQNENSIPEVSIKSPDNGAEIMGTITISGSASNDDGDETIETVEIAIEGGGWEQASGTTSWSYEWDTTQLTDGSYTVEVRAFDGKDYSDTKEITLTVKNVQENIKPEVTILAPLLNAEVSNEVDCTGRTSDEDGEIEWVEISFDESVWFKLTGTNVWSNSWDGTAL